MNDTPNRPEQRPGQDQQRDQKSGGRDQQQQRGGDQQQHGGNNPGGARPDQKPQQGQHGQDRDRDTKGRQP